MLFLQAITKIPELSISPFWATPQVSSHIGHKKNAQKNFKKIFGVFRSLFMVNCHIILLIYLLMFWTIASHSAPNILFFKYSITTTLLANGIFQFIAFMRILEAPSSSLNISKIGHGITTHGNRLLQNFFSEFDYFFQFKRRHGRNFRFRMNPHLSKNFIGIDIANASNKFRSH